MKLIKIRESGINTYQILDENGNPRIIKNKFGFITSYGIILKREKQLKLFK